MLPQLHTKVSYCTVPDDGHLIVNPYGQPMEAVAELLHFSIELLVGDPFERT